MLAVGSRDRMALGRILKETGLIEEKSAKQQGSLRRLLWSVVNLLIQKAVQDSFSCQSGKGSQGIEIKLGILQVHRHREQTCVCEGGWEVQNGGIGSLG